MTTGRDAGATLFSGAAVRHEPAGRSADHLQVHRCQRCGDLHRPGRGRCPGIRLPRPHGGAPGPVGEAGDEEARSRRDPAVAQRAVRPGGGGIAHRPGGKRLRRSRPTDPLGAGAAQQHAHGHPGAGRLEPSHALQAQTALRHGRPAPAAAALPLSAALDGRPLPPDPGRQRPLQPLHPQGPLRPGHRHARRHAHRRGASRRGGEDRESSERPGQQPVRQLRAHPA
ncbi:hypothetical protein D9M69_388950 [compost metagenome]